MTTETKKVTEVSEVSEGSIWGALMYNINEKFGWMLGDPTPEEVVLYSDLVYSNGVFYDILLTPETEKSFKQYEIDEKKDQKLIDVASSALTYSNTSALNIYDVETYQKLYAKTDGLFGIAWLPWNPVGIEKDNKYYVKLRFGKNTPIKVNPMRKEAVMINLMTMGKILGISLATFYGGRFLWYMMTNLKPKV